MRKNTLFFFLLTGFFLAITAVPQTSYAFWCGEKTKAVPLTKNDYFAPRIEYCDCWWFFHKFWTCKTVTVGKKMIRSGRHYCAYISDDDPDKICVYLVNISEKCKVNDDGTRKWGGPRLVNDRKGKCQPRMLAPLPPPFCEPMAPIEITAQVIPEDPDKPETLIPGNTFFTPKIRVEFNIATDATDVSVLTDQMPLNELLAPRDKNSNRVIDANELEAADFTPKDSNNNGTIDASEAAAATQKEADYKNMSFQEMNYARDVNRNGTIDDAELYGNAQYVIFNNTKQVILEGGAKVQQSDFDPGVSANGNFTYEARVEDNEICVYRLSENILTERLIGCDARRDYMPKPVASLKAGSTFEKPVLLVRFPERPANEVAEVKEDQCTKFHFVDFCMQRDPINNLVCLSGYEDGRSFYVRKGTTIPYPLPEGFASAVPYDPTLPGNEGQQQAQLDMSEQYRCVVFESYRLCLQEDERRGLWIITLPRNDEGVNPAEAENDASYAESIAPAPYNSSNPEHRTTYETVTARAAWSNPYEVRPYRPSELGLCATLPPPKSNK